MWRWPIAGLLACDMYLVLELPVFGIKVTRYTCFWQKPYIYYIPELRADMFGRHASPLEVYVLWRSRTEVKMLRPTRFVVDSMKSSNKGGGVAEVCSSQTGLWFGTLRDRYARIRTYYVRPSIFDENIKHPPEVRSRDGHTCRTCVQKFRSISYKTSWTYRIFCRKHAYFR